MTQPRPPRVLWTRLRPQPNSKLSSSTRPKVRRSVRKESCRESLEKRRLKSSRRRRPWTLERTLLTASRLFMPNRHMVTSSLSLVQIMWYLRTKELILQRRDNKWFYWRDLFTNSRSISTKRYLNLRWGREKSLIESRNKTWDSSRSTLILVITQSYSSQLLMRQLNTLRNSSKFKIRTSKLSAKSRPIERRQLLPPRRRVSVQRKPPLLLPIQMRVQKIKMEPRLKSRRLPLLMPQQRTRTASVS